MKKDGSFKVFLWSAGLVMATTLGAGLFTLPYVFREAGWLINSLYLFLLTTLVVFAHHLYWRVLEKLKEKNLLLGLTRTYLGRAIFGWAFFVIVGGLLLALVIYLILAGQFLAIIFPSLGFWRGVALFWLIASLPLFVSLRRFVGVELVGGILMIIIVFFIFFTPAPEGILAAGAPAVNLKNFFLPFGPLLFALAGWTAVEPVFAYQKKAGLRAPHAMALGTVFTALLYLVFVLAIFNSGGEITPDTFSGLTQWPFWRLALLGWLGLFAIWTSYIPIALEIRNSLEKDLGWPALASVTLVTLLPPLLIVLGLKDFLKVISLAGGIFLGLQYIGIILISRRALLLNSFEKFLSQTAVILFALAAVYEVYYFVVQ